MAHFCFRVSDWTSVRVAARFVVERREGFVEQQHRLVAQQRAREGDALLLAAGERRGPLRREVGQPEFGEGGGDARRIGVRQAERDIAGGAQMLEQRFGLEQDRDGPLFRRQCVDDVRRRC